MLPHPHPQCLICKEDAFGIFLRGEDNYTIAVLIPSRFNSNLFTLYLVDSETKVWTRKNLSVESPQKELTIDIPVNYRQILQHNTSTVVILRDKIGWVDLWRGIVFCNMLSEKHTLTCVPVPPPLKLTKRNVDSSNLLGHARFHRGIAFTNGCLRLVEVDSDVVAVDAAPNVYDEETGWPRCRTENWTMVVWTNKEMDNSYDGWHMECTLQASDIFLGDHPESQLPQMDLQNFFVCDPTIGVNENDSHIVYLTVRRKYMHPSSWVLAVDTRDRKVLSVVKSGPPPQEKRFIDTNYCSCSISN